MNEEIIEHEDDDDVDSGFAPANPLDGREVGEWESAYPPNVRKEIVGESIYTGLFFTLYLAGVFLCLFFSDEFPPADASETEGTTVKVLGMSASIFGYACALLGGGLGGCLYATKWLYHVVAKMTWHQDRRLWRICTPHLSAALALMVVIIASSGALGLFEEEFVTNHKQVLTLSMLAGLFSDKAIAKLSEVAETLFGQTTQKPAKYEIDESDHK